MKGKNRAATTKAEGARGETEGPKRRSLSLRSETISPSIGGKKSGTDKRKSGTHRRGETGEEDRRWSSIVEGEATSP